MDHDAFALFSGSPLSASNVLKPVRKRKSYKRAKTFPEMSCDTGSYKVLGSFGDIEFKKRRIQQVENKNNTDAGFIQYLTEGLQCEDESEGQTLSKYPGDLWLSNSNQAPNKGRNFTNQNTSQNFCFQIPPVSFNAFQSQIANCPNVQSQQVEPSVDSAEKKPQADSSFNDTSSDCNQVLTNTNEVAQLDSFSLIFYDIVNSASKFEPENLEVVTQSQEFSVPKTMSHGIAPGLAPLTPSNPLPITLSQGPTSSLLIGNSMSQGPTTSASLIGNSMSQGSTTSASLIGNSMSQGSTTSASLIGNSMSQGSTTSASLIGNSMSQGPTTSLLFNGNSMSQEPTIYSSWNGNSMPKTMPQELASQTSSKRHLVPQTMSKIGLLESRASNKGNSVAVSSSQLQSGNQSQQLNDSMQWTSNHTDLVQPRPSVPVEQQKGQLLNKLSSVQSLATSDSLTTHFNGQPKHMPEELKRKLKYLLMKECVDFLTDSNNTLQEMFTQTANSTMSGVGSHCTTAATDNLMATVNYTNAQQNYTEAQSIYTAENKSINTQSAIIPSTYTHHSNTQLSNIQTSYRQTFNKQPTNTQSAYNQTANVQPAFRQAANTQAANPQSAHRHTPPLNKQTSNIQTSSRQTLNTQPANTQSSFNQTANVQPAFKQAANTQAANPQSAHRHTPPLNSQTSNIETSFRQTLNIQPINPQSAPRNTPPLNTQTSNIQTSSRQTFNTQPANPHSAHRHTPPLNTQTSNIQTSSRQTLNTQPTNTQSFNQTANVQPAFRQTTYTQPENYQSAHTPPLNTQLSNIQTSFRQTANTQTASPQTVYFPDSTTYQPASFSTQEPIDYLLTPTPYSSPSNYFTTSFSAHSSAQPKTQNFENGLLSDPNPPMLTLEPSTPDFTHVKSFPSPKAEDDLLSSNNDSFYLNSIPSLCYA